MEHRKLEEISLEKWWWFRCQVVSNSCDPMDCSLPGSSVHGISQARILEWVAMPSSRGFSQPRDQTHISCVSCLGRQILYHCSIWWQMSSLPLSVTWEALQETSGSCNSKILLNGYQRNAGPPYRAVQWMYLCPCSQLLKWLIQLNSPSTNHFSF